MDLHDEEHLLCSIYYGIVLTVQTDIAGNSYSIFRYPLPVLLEDSYMQFQKELDLVPN